MTTSHGGRPKGTKPENWAALEAKRDERARWRLNRDWMDPKPGEQIQRFFARVITFDIACPNCDETYCVRRVPVHRTWNPRASTWKCRKCGLVLVIGIYAHPVVPGLRLPPPDHVPSLRQALSLRRQLDARMAVERLRRKRPANKILGTLEVREDGTLRGWEEGLVGDDMPRDKGDGGER